MMMEFVIPYMAYILGVCIMTADKIAKNVKIAQASPDKAITYDAKKFFKDEKWNLVLALLLGIASVIVAPMLISGTTLQALNKEGNPVWNMPLKTAIVPLQIVIGIGGGRGILAWLGTSEKQLSRQIDASNSK